MTESLRFIPFTEAYLDDVLAIEIEAYPDPWSVGMFRDELKCAFSHFDLAFIGDELIGYGGFWRVADEAHITSVTVTRVHRGQGLGRALLDHLLAQARAQDMRIATLEVRRSNSAAIRLYESEGFRCVGVREKYYPNSGEDALVMLKDLIVSKELSA